jgi:hypothetical protein
VRDASEITEDEAELVNRLIEAYPAALSYTPDRDPPVHQLAMQLIEEGRITRQVLDDAKDPATGAPVETMIGYRLADEQAEEIRQVSAKKSDAAKWN